MDSLSLVKMFKWKHFKNNFIIYLSRAFKISEYLKCLCVTFIETCSKSDHFENNNFNVNCFRENTFKKKLQTLEWAHVQDIKKFDCSERSFLQKD